MSIYLQWKAVAVLGRSITSSEEVGTVAFHAKPSPGLYRQLGVALNHAYVPLVLDPTATLYQLLRNKLNSLGHDQISVMPPFRITVPGLGPSQFRVRTRIYAPNIIVVTMRIESDLDLSIDSDFNTLVGWRYLDGLEVVKEIIRLIVGIVDSGDHRNPTANVRFRTLPACHLSVACDGEYMPHFTKDRARAIAALLLGLRKPQGMSLELIDSVISRNRELNKKTSSEQLYINKQGVLYLTAADAARHDCAERFKRMTDLTEIGCVFQEFLNGFGVIRGATEDFGDYIFTQIRAWLDHPEAIFARSYTNRLAWEVVAEEYMLKEKLAVASSNPAMMESIESKRAALDAIADNWWAKPDFAQTFNNALAYSVQALGKISDATLRESVLADIREAERAYTAQCYKAAVVMAGSAVEAILLALLKQETTEQNLESKGLHDLLSLTRQYGLVSDSGLLSVLDNTVRDWRNMVHPGKALRTSVTLSEGNARIAVAAMDTLAKLLK